MFYIRTTKTASGATAVQIVRYQGRQKIIAAHLGSAHNTPELIALKQAAITQIEKMAQQPSLFAPAVSAQVIPLDQCHYLGFRYTLVYETLSKLFTLFKFHRLNSPLLTDLVVARIIAPGSKLQSLQFLEEFLGIQHQRRDLYRQLALFNDLYDQVETHVWAIAKKEFKVDCSLVFYDVTTLYFESFSADELRKPGFSKDNKSQQPQIVIGLIVNTDGFPLAYQMFAGNTFEGHTFMPVISAFQRKHNIKCLTVVADAAMISLDNILALQAGGLQYIVGARTGSLSPQLITQVSTTLQQRDGATIRLPSKYGDLVCEFSSKRFAKDKRELTKQLTRAKTLLANPATIKRAKFIKTHHSTYALNTTLLDKTQLLLGVKGYYTNLGTTMSDRAVVQQYHNLWHVEAAFRIAKSDLQMRPIYHFKEKSIKAHLLICFMALAVCKYMELKTGKSTKHILKLLKSVTDARILNTKTNEEVTLRSQITTETKQILTQLGVWY